MATDSPFEPNTSAIEAFVLGVIEASINRVLASDNEGASELKALSGHVIRVKTLEPYLAFYILFTDSGIQVAPFYDGAVDARIKAPAAKLLAAVFNQNVMLGPNELDVQMTGDRMLVHRFFRIINRYDLWSVSKNVLSEWFPDVAHWPDLLEKLHNVQPEWVDAIRELPTQLQQSHLELQESLKIQQEMLQELRSINQHLHKGSKRPSFGLMGVLLVFLLGGTLGVVSGGFIYAGWLSWMETAVAAGYPKMLISAGCAVLAGGLIWSHYRSNTT